MNIYDAIMQAADHIETHPREFNFHNVYVPASAGCGTPGCALGWIGCFAGFSTKGHTLWDVTQAMSLGGMDGDVLFYGRMREIEGAANWRKDPAECARCLRVYAAKYHGHEKPVAPPNWQAMASRQTVGENTLSQELYRVT